MPDCTVCKIATTVLRNEGCLTREKLKETIYNYADAKKRTNKVYLMPEIHFSCLLYKSYIL